MTRITLDVHCPHCWSGHQVHKEIGAVTSGVNSAETVCPHCGKPLRVAYELRAAVVRVQAAVDLQVAPLVRG